MPIIKQAQIPVERLGFLRYMGLQNWGLMAFSPFFTYGNVKKSTQNIRFTLFLRL
jgi:hypothetical protein